jgi:hypothetical protein
MACCPLHMRIINHLKHMKASELIHLSVVLHPIRRTLDQKEWLPSRLYLMEVNGRTWPFNINACY